jgi:hypothetical protein
MMVRAERQVATRYMLTEQGCGVLAALLAKLQRHSGEVCFRGQTENMCSV